MVWERSMSRGMGIIPSALRRRVAPQPDVLRDLLWCEQISHRNVILQMNAAQLTAQMSGPRARGPHLAGIGIAFGEKKIQSGFGLDDLRAKCPGFALHLLEKRF